MQNIKKKLKKNQMRIWRKNKQNEKLTRNSRRKIKPANVNIKANKEINQGNEKQ